MSLLLENLISSYKPLQDFRKRETLRRKKIREKSKRVIKLQTEQRASFFEASYPYGILKKQKRNIKIFAKLTRMATRFSGIKVRILNPNVKQRTNPVIYAISHVCKYDLQIIYGYLNDHAKPLTGSNDILNKGIEGWC